MAASMVELGQLSPMIVKRIEELRDGSAARHGASDRQNRFVRRNIGKNYRGYYLDGMRRGRILRGG